MVKKSLSLYIARRTAQQYSYSSTIIVPCLMDEIENDLNSYEIQRNTKKLSYF